MMLEIEEKAIRPIDARVIIFNNPMNPFCFNIYPIPIAVIMNMNGWRKRM